MSQELIAKSRKWLQDSACPLWLKTGMDRSRGGFYESLSLQGVPVEGSRRVMVQARQVFSSHVAMQLGVISKEEGREGVRTGIDFILKHYSLPSGAFLHAIDENLKPVSKPEDLYAQAFALFALAHAQEVLGGESYKTRAKALLQYLKTERRAPKGGYTELSGKEIQFEANPHMHLFEALLYWMEVDKDPAWKEMADEILDLCLLRFVDAKKGLLAEHFTEQWSPILQEGLYIFEPGHHYEWVWLLGRYQKLAGKNLREVRAKLYDVSESYGIDSGKKSAFDEVKSDLSPNKKTARFWPQCERMKAALQMGQEADDKKAYAKAADEALESLFKFLEVPVPGLWYDTWLENGEFTQAPAKASSLYHIIGAMADYIHLRPSLN